MEAPAKTSRSNRRARYWINPNFQGRYLRMILLLELFVMGVTALLSFSLAFLLFNENFLAGREWNSILGSFVAFVVIIGLVLGYLGVRVSHRICGPIFRVKQALDALARDQALDRLKLREGDEFADLAEILNEIIEGRSPRDRGSPPSGPPPSTPSGS